MAISAYAALDRLLITQGVAPAGDQADPVSEGDDAEKARQTQLLAGASGGAAPKSSR